jgi:hypothetical protein
MSRSSCTSFSHSDSRFLSNTKEVSTFPGNFFVENIDFNLSNVCGGVEIIRIKCAHRPQLLAISTSASRVFAHETVIVCRSPLY